MADGKQKRSDRKAGYRPKVSKRLRQALVQETGHKCANPGCANRLLDLHHIARWHVYETHDQKTMIAICPTCHAHAHRGELKITDRTVFLWKARCLDSIDSPPVFLQHHVYVTPAQRCSLVLGTLRFANASDNETGITVFRLSENNCLGFRLVDAAALKLDLRICDTAGQELIRVNEGYLTLHSGPDVHFESRAGKYQVRVPATGRFVPEWVLESYNQLERPLVVDGLATVVDIEVIAPGTVRVQGIWADDQKAAIITSEDIAICRPPRTGFSIMVGCDEAGGKLAGTADPEKLPIIKYTGPLTFGILDEALTQHN